MKVRNNYTTHLGLGDMRILPGETAELPKGYGENHPVVKWYIARGWLSIVGKGNGKGKAANAAQVNVALNTGGLKDDPDGGDKTHLDPEQFGDWSDEQVFRLAVDMGIDLGDTPEREDIIAKIAAEEVEVGEYTDLNPEDYDADGDENASSELAKKNVDKLTLDELKALAAEMKLEVVGNDTRKTLIEKIKAAKKVEE